MNLFIVFLGASAAKSITELNTYSLCLAINITEAKKSSKENFLKDAFQVHTDNIFEVEICFEIEKVNGYYIVLEFTGSTKSPIYHNEYHIIPKNVVSKFLSKKES